MCKRKNVLLTQSIKKPQSERKKGRNKNGNLDIEALANAK